LKGGNGFRKEKQRPGLILGVGIMGFNHRRKERPSDRGADRGNGGEG